MSWIVFAVWSPILWKKQAMILVFSYPSKLKFYPSLVNNQLVNLNIIYSLQQQQQSFRTPTFRTLRHATGDLTNSQIHRAMRSMSRVWSWWCCRYTETLLGNHSLTLYVTSKLLSFFNWLVLCKYSDPKTPDRCPTDW